MKPLYELVPTAKPDVFEVRLFSIGREVREEITEEEDKRLYEFACWMPAKRVVEGSFPTAVKLRAANAEARLACNAEGQSKLL